MEVSGPVAKQIDFLLWHPLGQLPVTTRRHPKERFKAGMKLLHEPDEFRVQSPPPMSSEAGNIPIYLAIAGFIG